MQEAGSGVGRLQSLDAPAEACGSSLQLGGALRLVSCTPANWDQERIGAC